MSRVFITMGSAYSKATNVNPVDGIWCSDCGWAGRVEEDMTDSEESEEPLFEEFSEYVPKFCPNCGVNVREHGGCRAGRGCGTQPLLSARHAHRYPRAREEGQGFGGLTDGKERGLHGKAF